MFELHDLLNRRFSSGRPGMGDVRGNLCFPSELFPKVNTAMNETPAGSELGLILIAAPSAFCIY